MLKNEIEKKIERRNVEREKTRVNLTNPWPRIWNQDNLVERKTKQSWNSRPNNLMSNDEIENKINLKRGPKKY
jgi:hypothetical protein